MKSAPFSTMQFARAVATPRLDGQPQVRRFVHMEDVFFFINQEHQSLSGSFILHQKC